ncbi:transporter substrate-binding domain-containing protein [Mesorhizobium sp. AR07]|uniref:substrate-binding periplasmic protein n=1 Tax=Mesorhizobium sp. AR07 TaxID=2865838 RepID=UPI0021608FAC|nr:transporter substrate-binding domain-containing protein [Mesorhizobium sp. AR07]UVK47119.1 transporter substrate-binding domain-containing protein [Mesorhizobium sp. AR07]
MSVKRSFLVAASLCAAAAFASSAASAADESLSRIQAAKKVVVCSSNDVPYAYKNPTSGKVEGTDIDMVRAIFEPLGVPEIELYEVPISGIISALNTSRCDLISDNIAITVKRQLQTGLAKGIATGDSESAEAMRDLIETVTVFRDPSRIGGIEVEISGRLTALLGEGAFPHSDSPRFALRCRA